LIKEKGVSPDKILLLAFTNKATDELTERAHKLGLNLKVQTFHSFGNSILSEGGKARILAFNNSKKEYYDFIEEKIESLLKNDSDFLSLVYRYFKYHIHNRKPITLDGEITTMKGEKVKSYQEQKIANFLHINRIEYQYEPSYIHNTETKDRRQYQPDFLLTDYDIYIEHFGINKEGEPPADWSKLKKEKYKDGIIWKRELHYKNNTKLIETFSWEFDEGIFIESFTQKLSEYNIIITEKPTTASLFQLAQSERKFYFIFTELISKFIQLYKSNNFTEKKLNENKNRIDVEKANDFIKIFFQIFNLYQKYLIDNIKIDFSDMICESTALLNNKVVARDYQYVLVDEFQDISYGRYELLLALRKQNPKLKFYCVGDDWQSIFRFTGSDINLFSSFDEYFGYTKKSKILNTYRYSQEIADLTDTFITKNPIQIPKKIKAQSKLRKKPFQIYYYDNHSLSAKFDEIFNEVIKAKTDKKIDVLLLGRYKFTEDNYKTEIKRLKKQYGNDVNIEFMTVHKAKGLESDYVIILDVIDDTYGFPSKVLDDDVINLVLLKDENYEFAEERRLFYVAMTRAKNRFFILNNKRREISTFIKEIIEIHGVGSKDECNICNGKMIERNGEHGSFLSCENYPVCRFKQNLYRSRYTREINQFFVRTPVTNIKDEIIEPPEKDDDITNINSEDKISIIKNAINSGQLIRFNYKKSETFSNGEESIRTVKPDEITLVGLYDSMCVKGYCYLREAERTFAIDRISNLISIPNAMESEEESDSEIF
jgi:DNA helicase-4